jgi:hypothetical protein
MNCRTLARLMTLTLLISVATAAPCWAASIVPDGVDDAWHNQPVTVTFKADGQAVVNKYRLGGETVWRQGDHVTITAEGVTSLYFLSSTVIGGVLPITDATFETAVLRHPGLVLAEFWAPW